MKEELSMLNRNESIDSYIIVIMYESYSYESL